MNIIGKYESIVADHPKIFLVVLIVITLFLAPNLAQFEFEAGDEDFQPDTEIAEANSMIRDEYGEEGRRVTVISDASGNVLSLHNLLMQVDLEDDLNESDIAEDRLRKTSEAPYGVSSPARLIAQARFIDRAMEEAPTGIGYTTEVISSQPPNGEEDFEDMIRGELMEKANTLTIEEMRTILNGDGDITLEIEGMPFPIEIGFEEPFYPEELNEYEMEFFPLEDILPFLLSEDYDPERQHASKSITGVLIVEGLDDDEILETEKKIQSTARNIEDEETRLRVIGDALIDEEVNEASSTNIGILMPLAFIFVIVVLGIMYRNITDTILNLIALIMAVIWTYGIGVLLGINLGNPMMTTVPVLVIGLGIDYGIHFTSRYREELREGRDVRDAMSRTGTTVGFAILLTTVTTVVGFLSNLGSNISIIRQFGVLCAIGIVSAFILMLTFFPSAKTLIDGWRKKRGKELVKEKTKRRKKKKDKRTFGQKFWSKIGEPETFCEADRDCVNNGLGLGAIAARTPVAVVVVVLLITSVGAYGGLQLEAEYSFTDFLPEDLEVTESVNMFVNEFDFSEETVYIMVEGDVTDPQVLRNVERARDAALASDYAVPARSSETVYNIGEEMFADGTFDDDESESWRKIVEDDEATNEDVELVYSAMMRERREDTERVLKEDHTGTLLRIPVDTEEEKRVKETQEDMENAAEVFGENDLDRVIVTGGPIVSQSTFESINEGQIQTLAITFIIAFLILAGLYLYLGKGPLLGAITILPLVFVITWTFGAMYFFGIPLNPVTVTIAAITVGLGIDFSIHLTQRFNEDTENIPHPECAICVSAGHTGSALFGSAATTIAGFGILSFAVIPPLAQFGQVSALSIFFAFIAAVFVSPTFLLVWYKFKYRNKKE